MALTHSEESSNTTPTSAGFANSNEVIHSRREYATSPSSDIYSQSRSFRTATPPLLRPPLGHAFTSHVKSWGAPEIASFLSLYNCDNYTTLFHNNDIDGKVLLDLDMASLKEIGISKIGDRVKLLGGVRDLRRRAARATPSLTLGASNVNAGFSSTEGSVMSSLENEARGSQVQKRLATALVSKRLQLSRPPPLNLQRHRPQALVDSSTIAPSPPLRSATPKSLQSQTLPRALSTGVDTSSTKPTPVSSSEMAAMLRPPQGREQRRSPSPIVDETMWASTLRPDLKSAIERRQASSAARHGDSSVRVDYSGKPNSPTQYFVPGQREESLHPFASASRTGESHASREAEQRRVLAKHHQGTSNSHMTAPKMSPVELSSRFGHAASQPKSLEVLKRSIVKFVNSEDGTTRTVNVSGCTSGVEVLEMVLKKFSKTTGGLGADVDSDNDTLEVDGWRVFIKAANSEEDIPLTESALLDFCHGHHSTHLSNHYDAVAVREKRLLLRRVARPLNRKNMEIFFGEVPPAPLSPNSPSHYGGPRLGRQNGDHDSAPRESTTVDNKKMNRASTVSVMSGLGAPVPGVMEPMPSPNSARSSTNGGNIGSRTKRMYNFFGHRPPSELISNHLSEYFPSARKRDLEKTVRQSMLRLSQGQGDRQMAIGQHMPQSSPGSTSPKPSLDSEASLKRSARPQSTRTVSSSTTPAAIPEEGEAMQSSRESGSLSPGAVDNHPPLLPPFESTGESLVDSLQQFSPAPSTVRASLRPGRRSSSGSTLSRISVISSIRKHKDKSDSASLLTVDEITAEVGNRRASMSTFNESVDSDQPVTPAAGSDVLLSDDEDDVSDSDSEDLDAEETPEPTSDDEGKDQGRAYTSTGSRRIIKWMKGALVGAGSFGSVFLGMDAQSGLLMAVKQVELPSGDVRNEERKRNMVQALEREIELLKELSHENIVQYLDSASDGNNLYIFLEYVPGGSVAALLNNYGAFEEALVRNFVRQILTGLNYLHERNIIHRDIKGANILVDNKGGIKISDFGISKKTESNLMERANRPSLQGSVFWMAPEVVKQTSYTSKADIWSVGCLVVEMLTGTHPWAKLSQMQAIFRIGSMVRPANPSDISSDAADFLNRTFEINHDARPTAAELLEHPFIAGGSSSQGPISLEQASATLEAVAASRQSNVAGMSLGLAVRNRQNPPVV